MVELRAIVTGRRTDDDGDLVVDVRTEAVNQRDDVVIPAWAVIALPGREQEFSPAAGEPGQGRACAG